MLIAEELLLLLYDDERGKPITEAPGLDYALAGAVLIELTLLGRVELAGPGEATKKGRLKVLDPTPTGDPLLDDRLTVLVDKAGSKPADLMAKLSKKLREAVLARLAERGILRADKGKVLGLFPVTRWPAEDVRHESEVRLALDNVLKLGTTPNERTGALVALLHALDVVHKVVDGPDRKALKRRAKEISESTWAADAVRHAVQAVQAATITAIAASAAAAASVSV
jgi:hypothetical protein